MSRTDPRSLLPLSPVVLHLLLVLSGGERHGYAIAREIESATGGQIRMGPGTLYGSIQRMLSSSLIEPALHRRRTNDDDDERRRYYRLTTLGRRTLDLELERLAQVIELARGKRLLRGPGIA
ncbi:MAG: PadR family transcriptional regulator [Gemmatimonadales bacterium]|jgi:DNA-binding PadR family transcriptional regulator